MKKFILYFIAIWPFLWENARMKIDYVGSTTYKYFHLVPLSRDGRWIEIGFVFLVLLSIFLNKEKTFYSTKIFFPTLIISIISLISGIINNSPFIGILQVTYIYIVPFLIFIISFNLNFSFSEMLIIGKVLIIFLILNVVSGIIQVFILNQSFDNVTGVAWDAHILANFSFIITFFLITYSFFHKKYKFLIYIPLALLPPIFASNQKANIIFVLVLFIPSIFFKYKSRFAKIGVLLFFVLLSCSFLYLVFSLDNEFSNRLEYVSSEKTSDLSIFKSYTDLPINLYNQPFGFILGYGPGMYRTTESTFDVRNPEGYFGNEVGISTTGMEGAWALSVSLFTLIGGQLGLISLYLFIYNFYFLGSSLIKIIKRTNLNQIKIISISLLMYLAYIFLYGMLSPYAGWNSTTLTWPFFLIFGIILRNEFSTIQK